MIYEIANPSDPYTIEGDFLPCAIGVLVVGEGRYSIRPIEHLDNDEAKSSPLFLFAPAGSIERWLKSIGVDDLASWIDEHRIEIAAALDTVMIGSAGDRRRYDLALSLIPADKHREFRDRWHDEKRSSMNDIGSACWALAQRLRSKR